MTYLERARQLLADDPDEMDEAWLAGIIAAARREGAEAAVVKLKAEAVADAERRGAEEMRERAARLADGFCTDRTDDVAQGIRALPLTPEDPA